MKVESDERANPARHICFLTTGCGRYHKFAVESPNHDFRGLTIVTAPDAAASY